MNAAKRSSAIGKQGKRRKTPIPDSAPDVFEYARLLEEIQSLRQSVAEREVELAIIQSVQAGLVSGLDMQAIYDLVGDKIRELFQNTDAEIRIYDAKKNVFHIPYFVENKQRYAVGPISLSEARLSAHVMRTGQTLIINENFSQKLAEFGAKMVAGRRFLPKSAVFVPLMASNQARGLMILSNVECEHAYSDSDVRLFETLANSMSTSLENARLFNETQHLIKEAEQRAAELTIINSVQAGLASKMDMQSIYDLVGDKIRDLFDAQMVGIAIFDLTNRTRHFRYGFYHHKISFPEVVPFNWLTEHLIATQKALVINQDAETRIAEFEMVALPGWETFKSAVFVPLISGAEVIGFVTLQNVEKENVFSESDVRLLSTIASSMSVALENARLFDETQRLLRGTEQRNAELAIINSVQEGLASKLDMQSIYDLVGEKIRDLFNAQSVWIAIFDPATRTRQFRYGFYRRRLNILEALPFNRLTEHLIVTKKPFVINQNADAQKAKFEMVVLPGSEMFKSAIFVPLIVGGDVKGFVTLQNVEQENAFSDSDISLLSTLTSSMSVALENARLFDETQRLFLEAKEARMAAEKANQAKSVFLSSMSHELRTPLNAIINFVEMIARGMIGPVNQEQVELLDQALHSSKHLLNLINDVLDISKIQAGQLTLFIEDQVSVHVEMEAALSITGGLIQEKGLQLIRDIDSHLPLISCDRRRLRQVLINLISNAIKFTNQGTVTVSIKNQGSKILFAVIDTGPGIPPDKHELIFEPFIQAENDDRQIQGTGLGLPISRSLVLSHGGELWVESEQGEGTAFFFTLPVDRRSSS